MKSLPPCTPRCRSLSAWACKALPGTSSRSLSSWNPSQRLCYSIMALVMSLATLITSNLGGFLLGLLLGLVGGSLAFAWNP
ncbi:MAG TPA: DUF6114 domain-containing protein [Candidatus Limnocylindrales bacterium]